jgi:hypothetical protein
MTKERESPAGLAHKLLQLFSQRQTDGRYSATCNKMKGDTTMTNGNARFLIVGATALMTGFCIGVGAGVLFAPYSGARTRRHLRGFAEDMVEDRAEVVDKVIERGRRVMGL